MLHFAFVPCGGESNPHFHLVGDIIPTPMMLMRFQTVTIAAQALTLLIGSFELMKSNPLLGMETLEDTVSQINALAMDGGEGHDMDEQPNESGSEPESPAEDAEWLNLLGKTKYAA